MGGRGSTGGYGGVPVFRWPEPDGYTVRASHEQENGVLFPFLPQHKLWRVVSTPVRDVVEKEVVYDSAHTLGMTVPTVRWVKDGKVHDLYVDGTETAAFLQQAGLQLDVSKGGAVMAKRLSRVMRPQVAHRFFAREAVAIHYMEQTAAEVKVWDGAGLVSRNMVERVLEGGQLTAERQRKVRHDLLHSQRVEFTVLTANGQDKGHALVVEDLRDPVTGRPIDFLLPQDTKSQVCLTDAATTFVSFNAVHGKSEMRLDIQSLINHHHFFDNEQLLQWQQDETALYLAAIETGEIQPILQRMASAMGGEEEEGAWPVYQYLANGGDPKQFRSVIRQVMNQQLARLQHTQLEKLRLSVPGGRYYVLPAGVGEAAGRHVMVERGEIFIDPETETAYVNDADWVRMHDANRQADNAGIADLLGGADNDDALWLFGFSDEDDGGQRKVLAWRSPNQKGEYVVLKPTAASASLPWREQDGTKSAYPTMHSSQLATRTDFVEKQYTGGIDPDAVTSFEAAYSVEGMTRVIDDAYRNDGILGMYCNAQMVQEAVFGALPDTLPASLEAVIDSTQKTGADVAAVRQWCYEQTQRLLTNKVPLPELLHKRLSVDFTLPREERPPAPRRTMSASPADKDSEP